MRQAKCNGRVSVLCRTGNVAMAKIEPTIARRTMSNKKHKIADTVVGAALGAAIAGPAGAVAGGLLGSQTASHASPAAKTRRAPKAPMGEPDDPLVHVELKHILVPLDFSKPSRLALRFARKWAVRFGSEVRLLHVIEPAKTFVAFESEPFTCPLPTAQLHEQARIELEELAREEFPESVKTSVLVREGVAFDQITTVAREMAADLIIIATHGHTGLSRALMGSTAERVVRHAPCPVLTLRRAR
jgi:nucleotide-binding universal stress UspA family protein